MRETTNSCRHPAGPLPIPPRMTMNRRLFCVTAGALLLSARTSSGVPGREQQVPFSEGSAPPRNAVPDPTCDCHMHIYDDRFPAAPTATLRPPNATVKDYRALQARLGTKRTVVVTPSTYGTDNRCLLDALGQFGPDARGIAVVDTNVSSAELKQLSDTGVRGIRFNLVVGAVTTIEMIEPLAKRVHDLGWHIQINMPPDQLIASESLLQRIPTPIVVDHMARVPAEPSPQREMVLAVVRRSVETGRAWVKLTAPYLGSKSGPPAYQDASLVVADLVKLNPERMLWGTDWPHPTHQKHLPDDAVLVDRLVEWVPDPAQRRRILVDNPQSLYKF